MTSEREQTIRQEIIKHLENGPLTAKDISRSVGIMEKDVYHHMAFIEKTVRNQEKRLNVTPYYCLACGFKFNNRKTFKKPGKCPGCRDGRIGPAVFLIVGRKD